MAGSNRDQLIRTYDHGRAGSIVSDYGGGADQSNVDNF